MESELIFALALFACVTSITPGPNNLMLMASGANFGFRRSIPHMLGIGIGFVVMVLLIGFGLVRVFDAWPESYRILQMLSILYLLFLAWKTATAAGIREGRRRGTPMSFLQAAAFQWVNPKAWAMALGAIGAYAPERSIWGIACVALIFGLVNLPCVSVWTVLGKQLARVLTNQRRRIIFNITMSLLLLATLIPVLQSSAIPLLQNR